MDKKIAYILTRFPWFSETFVYHEIKNLIREGCPIDTIIALRREHSQGSYDLSAFNIIYPPPLYVILNSFIAFALMHPMTLVKIVLYLADINRGDFFHLKKGYTSFIKGFLLLPLIIWINKELGSSKLHFHAHFPVMATTTAMLLAKLRSTTFSFTGHGTDILEYGPKSLSRRINRSSFFITVSEYNKQFIIKNFEHVNANEINVIPAVIDTETFRAIRKPSEYTKPDIIRFITVARLSPEKGHEVFLHALAKFSKQRTDFHYSIIGEGALHRYLQDLVKILDIEKRVTFYGYCNQAFIVNALSESHLFVLTSYKEGLPVALMEAATAGLPIYATRITAIPELVRHNYNGYLVEAGDEESMYQGLKALAANNWELLMEITHHAAYQDTSHFAMQTTVPRIKELLLSAVRIDPGYPVMP